MQSYQSAPVSLTMKFVIVVSILLFTALSPSSAELGVLHLIVHGGLGLKIFLTWLRFGTQFGQIVEVKSSPLKVFDSKWVIGMQSITSRFQDVSVAVGSSHRSGNSGQRHTALRLCTHPDYVSGPNVYDVAIMWTTTRMVFSNVVQPISLSNVEIGVGSEGIFTGWRFILLHNMLTFNKWIFGQFLMFNVDQKICIFSGFRQSVCGCDSGSPLVINGAVAGVVRLQIIPCGDGLPDVFIRMSAVRDWIMSMI